MYTPIPVKWGSNGVFSMKIRLKLVFLTPLCLLSEKIVPAISYRRNFAHILGDPRGMYTQIFVHNLRADQIWGAGAIWK